MDITLVKNPAKRRTRKAKSSKKQRKALREVLPLKRLGELAEERCGSQNRSNPKRKTAKRKAASRRKNPSTRRRRTARKNPTTVVEKVPVIGKTKFAKKADKEISPMAHGAQKWKSSSMPQKAVQVVGGFTGYGYGGSFTQMGQNFSDSALLGSGAGQSPVLVVSQ